MTLGPVTATIRARVSRSVPRYTAPWEACQPCHFARTWHSLPTLSPRDTAYATLRTFESMFRRELEGRAPGGMADCLKAWVAAEAAGVPHIVESPDSVFRRLSHRARGTKATAARMRWGNSFPRSFECAGLQRCARTRPAFSKFESYQAALSSL